MIYAACYNSTLKAYYLKGTLDTDGVVTFDNFILDNDTNITVFAIESKRDFNGHESEFGQSHRTSG